MQPTMMPSKTLQQPISAQSSKEEPRSKKQLQEEDQLEQFTRQKDDSDLSQLTIEEALKLYESSRKYVETGYRTHWDNYFKVYRGRRVERNYEGVSDISIRESHTIIETLVANIASGYPKFSFVTTNEEQSNDTDVLNEMMDYYMVCNQMGLKNQEWVREMLLYGTGVLGVEWRNGEPFIYNVPLRDFFFDPTSTGMIQTLNPAQYAGHEYLADKNELSREEIFDAESNKWVARYNNLDKIGKVDKKSGGKTSMDKDFKDMIQKSTLGEIASENQVHVIRLHHLPTGRIYEIGNKKEFIYNRPTWCQRKEETRDIFVEGPEGEEIKTKQTLDEIKPFLPYAIIRDYIDSSQFLGTGEMELLLADAELLNDYESMQVDNNAYQNTPMYWVDPMYADLIPEIETIPGATYPIPRNAMGTIERPQLSTDIDNKEERIMQRMRRSTAADEAVQGGAIGNSRTTATEVSTQLQQAQMRFSTKITNLESEGYAQLALIIFKVVQIFVTKKTAIRIVGEKGIYYKDFDPWEYNGRWEAHAQLDTTIKQNQVEVGLKDQAVYDALIKTPGINPVEVARWWTKKKDPSLTDEDFNKMLMPPQAPEDQTKDYVNVLYKDLEPYAKYQWQKSVGWQPDPALLGEMQNKMLEQANRGADLIDPATNVNNELIPGMEEIVTPPEATPAEAPADLQLQPA